MKVTWVVPASALPGTRIVDRGEGQSSLEDQRTYTNAHLGV